MLRRVLLPRLLFVPAFAVGYFAERVFTAFGLGWWDPKFGSPWGNVQVGLTLLPLFLPLALAGHVLGLVLVPAALEARPATAIAARQAAVGLLAPFGAGLLNWIAYRGAPDTPVGRVLAAVGPGWFLVATALLTVVAYWRRVAARSAGPRVAV